MKGTDSALLFSLTRRRPVRVLVALGLLYMLLVVFEVPFVLKNGPGPVPLEGSKSFVMDGVEEEPASQYKLRPERRIKELAANQRLVSSLDFAAGIGREENAISKSAKRALELGRRLWREVELIGTKGNSTDTDSVDREKINRNTVDCPHSISITGHEFSKIGGTVELPCGLTVGSHATVIGKPRAAHNGTGPKMWKPEDTMMVSHFVMELVGLKMAEGEEAPKIFHFNPRLEGDWSRKPVIEHNSCYRMQWGSSQRCQGRRSRAEEGTVDGLVKCERWSTDDDNWSEGLIVTRWLNRLIGRDKKTTINWPFPFAEEKIFVLTVRAGLEGFHMSVDGRHVTSFPYRDGFTLEDATGLSLTGDIDVVSILAASLPASRPRSAHKHLELSDRWRAPPIPDGPVALFIGILSAGSHFAERMAMRKSWMQHELIGSSTVVVRFIVALHRKKEVNVEVKKEAEFFGDIVIVPYLDHYDLVVLKTVAICEFGVRSVSANYIMKGDDDTFIRVDAVMEEAKKIEGNKSLYIGNMNYHHKPFRIGKWAVTDEEWPKDVYPTYANGPGYIISSDIANFILSGFEKNKLKLFKMEDVSMGMWVGDFNESTPVKYVHSLNFCQFGCIEDYITAHYQSPRLMICLWNKLRRLGSPSCCNGR